MTFRKKMVAKPNNNRIFADAIEGLKSHVNRLRWQEYFKIKHAKEKSKESETNSMLDDLSIDGNSFNFYREHNHDKNYGCVF